MYRLLFVITILLATIAGAAAPNIVPTSLMSAAGYGIGTAVGVRGGIFQYMAGGANEREVAVNVGDDIPGTTARPCRHAEPITNASGVSETYDITLDDGTLLVPGNTISIPGAIRPILFHLYNVAPSSGNITLTINSVPYVIPVTAGDGQHAVLSSVSAAVPGVLFSIVLNNAGTGERELTHYFADLIITTMDVDFGTTGLDGWVAGITSVGNVSVRTYTGEVSSIAGNTATMVDPIPTTFTNQTCTIDNVSVINFAMGVTPEEKACFIPAGLYSINDQINGGSLRTLRGAGSFAASYSSVEIGYGEKTFIVPAGIPYEPNIGIRIERRQEPTTYMQGRIVSYIGTSLVVNVTELNGSGTFDSWKCSITMFLFSKSSGSAVGTGGAEPSGSVFSITGSPVRGATAITVPGHNFTDGNMLRLTLRNQQDVAAIIAGATPVIDMNGYDRKRQQMTEIQSIAGDVITIYPPILFDLPVGLDPQASEYTNIVDKAGFESFSIRNITLLSPQALIALNVARDSWMYDIDSQVTANYAVGCYSNLFCEYRRCWVGYRPGGGTSGAGFLGSSSTGVLVIHSIFVNIFPNIEINFGFCGSAFLYNYGNGTFDTNHGAHNCYNLYEGNIFSVMVSDAYHGSESESIWYRNYAWDDYSASTYLKLCRFSRNCVMALNVAGEPGWQNGVISLGEPFFAGQAAVGVAEPTAGNVWPDLEVGYHGTITNKISANKAEVTLVANPASVSAEYWPIYVWWNNNANLRTQMTLISQSGTDNVVWMLEGLNSPGGNDMPENGTDVQLWVGYNGFPQLDLDVENTLIQEGNRIATGASSTLQPITPGVDQPASQAFTSRPPVSEWAADLPWPAINAITPVYSINNTASGRWWNTGSGATVGEATVSAVATVSGTTTVSGTFTVP